MLVPINITGGTFKDKAPLLSNQVSRNFWPRLVKDSSGKGAYVLDSFPGLRLWAQTEGNADRGMLEHKETLYKVTENALYSIASDKTITVLGEIPGNDRCVLFGAGDNIIVIAGGVAYEWNGTTLSAGSDVDFETPSSGGFLNSRAIYDGDDGRFCCSDVGNYLDINGLNYATAETSADDLIRVYTFDQLLYLFGEKTIETWWNSNQGRPPFDPIQDGTIPVGLGALHSVANDDDFIYWLADDNQVYLAQGSTAQVISDSALTETIAGYRTIEDAIGWTMSLRGTNMYCLTFPNAQKTWIWPREGEWFEWSFGIDGKRSLANSYSYAYRKHLVGDFRSGNIYELDFNAFDDNGSEIIRVRDTANINGVLLGAPGKTFELSRFELIMQVSVGTLSGQGANPVVMLSLSDDGGQTFGTEMFGEIGALGDLQWKVEWHNLGSFDNLVIRVRCSDPVYYKIFSAAGEFSLWI